MYFESNASRTAGSTKVSLLKINEKIVRMISLGEHVH